MTDLISRADAIEAICNAQCELDVPHYPQCDQVKWCDEVKALLALPSADAEQTDCTDFVNWLTEEEHLEIINRIKELQYAIARTQTVVGKMVESADAVQGEWVRHELWGSPWFTCSKCNYHGRNDYNYCPSCGARMKGGEDE